MINTEDYFKNIANANGWAYIYGDNFTKTIESIDLPESEISKPFLLVIAEISNNDNLVNNKADDITNIEFGLFKISQDYDVSEADKYNFYVYPCKLEAKNMVINLSCRDWDVNNYKTYPAYDFYGIAYSGIIGEFSINEP